MSAQVNLVDRSRGRPVEIGLANQCEKSEILNRDYIQALKRVGIKVLADINN